MSERLPALPPSLSQQAYSSNDSSPRVGSIDSSSSTLNSAASCNNSYLSTAASTNEPKTPPPTLHSSGPISGFHTPHNLEYHLQNAHTPYTYQQDSYSNMHPSNPDMFYPSQISGAQGNPSQTVTASGLTHYQHSQQQQHPSSMQAVTPQYAHTQTTPYASYGYANGLTSPQSAGSHHMTSSIHNSVVSLPPMATSQSLMSSQSYSPQQSQGFDTTGQQAPHGMKPRVTATLWEDEGSLCFQVEANGICVARREDNHMINGTKLLNVAGMTRGRRDGILKSEKQRHVVKIGPMHLKGVWIPFDRALDFANKEKITDQLYPLFVHHIGQLLYHPTNSSRTNVVMAHAERRKAEQSHMRNSQSQGALPPLPHHHHHTMQSSVGPSQLPSQLSGNLGPIDNASMPRPDLHRAHTFPTPPTSASGVMTSMGNTDGFQWNAQPIAGINSHSGLSIDTGLSNARSMPSTPATTPPGSSVQNLQYQQTPQAYDASRQLYSAPPLQSPFQHTNTVQQGMGRYGPLPYIKHEMGPPGGRAIGNEDHQDPKNNGLYQSSHQPTQVTVEEEADHEHDAEYLHDSHATDDSGGRPYTYAPLSATSDRAHLGQDLSGSPNHTNGRGGATPRTTAAPHPYYQQNGYNTPPQIQPPSSNLYNVISSERGTANGVNAEDYSGRSEGMAPSLNGYATLPSQTGKRSRDDEEESRPTSRNGDHDGLKRRRTVRENSLPHEAKARSRNPISQRRR